MTTHFVKMNGAGNDFIMIDNRSGGLEAVPERIREMCDRRRGVGADGVIFLESEPSADFRMRYYNRDGGEAEMCGNGARCVALFASALGLGRPDGSGRRLTFAAQPGLMEARVRGHRVAVSMTDAVGLRLGVSLRVAQATEIVHFVNTGVPHAVIVVDDAAAMDPEDIVRRGRLVRFHEEFSPAGANTNFVSPGSQGIAAIRTYERGVEAETLACGTGSVAAAVVLAHLGKARSPVQLRTRGDDLLSVSFHLEDEGASRVVLEGPAMVNFEGNLEIKGKD
jgi:diaminopimelate epimerase